MIPSSFQLGRPSYTWHAYKLAGTSRLEQKGVSAVNAFGAGPATVTLLDGRTINSNQILFDPNTYHEFYTATGEDITDNMKQADKVAVFPDFDIAQDDDRVYRETTIAQTGKDPGPPSTDTGAGFILSQTVKGTLSDIAAVATPTALVNDAKDLLFFVVIGAAIFYGISSSRNSPF